MSKRLNLPGPNASSAEVNAYLEREAERLLAGGWYAESPGGRVRLVDVGGSLWASVDGGPLRRLQGERETWAGLLDTVAAWLEHREPVLPPDPPPLTREPGHGAGQWQVAPGAFSDELPGDEFMRLLEEVNAHEPAPIPLPPGTSAVDASDTRSIPLTLELEPTADGFRVSVPVLPGRWGHGATEAEALERADKAVREYLARAEGHSDDHG